MVYSLTCVKLNIVRDELNLVRTSINQIIEAKVLVDEVLASSQANVQSLRKQIPYFKLKFSMIGNLDEKIFVLNSTEQFASRIFMLRDGNAVFFTYVLD